MNKLFYICLITLGTLITHACSPYGLTSNPNEGSVDNTSTQAEREAMSNQKTFQITIEEFEKNVQLQNLASILNETETGFITDKQVISINYKSSRNNEGLLESINILVNHPGTEIQTIEKDLITVLQILLTSLNIPYEPEQILASIKEEKTDVMNTDEVRIELMNFVENIQMIVQPN